jgi:hypothetical protein
VFVILASLRDVFSESENQTLQRGLGYLLKLAQHLCRFEQASRTCYVYKESMVNGREACSMIKIEDLESMVFKYPKISELREKATLHYKVEHDK